MRRRDPLMGVEPGHSPRRAPPPDPQLEAIRRRQRARAIITALLLGAFAILVYAITVAKMSLHLT
jgi:hypothetical protein